VVWGGSSGVNAGDTLWFAGGTYTTTLTPGTSGTPSAWISIKRVRSTDPAPTSAPGWNSSFDSQVIINSPNDALDFNILGLSYIIVDGRVDFGMTLVTPNSAGNSISFNHGANFITLTNLDLAGPGGTTPVTMNGDNRGIDATAWNGSAYEAVNNLLVTHCRIHGQVNNLWLMNVNDSTIEYTKMYDSGAVNSTTYHANVCATSNSKNVTWRYNEIYNHQVEGIMYIFGGAGAWYIYGNVWHDGMTSVSRCVEAQDGVEGPIYFYNNTVANVTMGLRTANGGSYAAGTQGRNNIYWNSSATGLPDSDYDFSNSGLSESHGVGNGANPFVNLAGQNYRIVSASGPVNKGTPLGPPFNRDLDGNIRGSDGTWDIGAFEFGTGVVDTNPPVVTLQSITSPVLDIIPLIATATDTGSGVASVSFLVDGNVVGTDLAPPYTWSWNSRSVGNGSHNIQARALDNAGNQTTTTATSITVQNVIDTTPPTATLTAPVVGATVSNSVSMTATASDNVGGSGIASVSFLIDGSVVGTVSNSPYALSWNSRSVANGSHTVQARATDASGNSSALNGGSVTVQNSALNIVNGLVGYWPFDDGSGTTVKDMSGGGSNGSLAGDAGWGSGIMSGAMSLAGGTGYARVPSTPAIELITNSFTVCVWVKFPTNSSYAVGDMQSVARKVIDEGNNAFPYTAYDLIVQDAGSGTFRARVAATRASDSTRSSALGNPHPYGPWYHLVGVYDGSTLRIYVNGVQESSAAFSGAVLQTGQPLCIGRYGTVAEPVNGLMDDFRLYNRALTPTEIQSLYGTAVPPAPFGLKIVPN
jgi:hypothetical protein